MNKPGTWSREYMSYYNPCLNFTGLTGNIDGTLTAAVSGSGAALTNTTGTVAPGGVTLSTGTTSTGRASILSSATQLIFGGGIAKCEFKFSFTTAVSDAEDYDCWVGFIDSASAAPTDGVFLWVDDGTNATRVRFGCYAAGTGTLSGDLTASFVAGTEYQIRIEVDSQALSARLYVNDVMLSEIAVSANIPDVAGQETGFGITALKAAGTTARLFTLRNLKVYKDKTTQV